MTSKLIDRYAVCAKLLQLCPTLCNSMDCSPPGCSVHGILQARKLEWVAVPSSRSSQPKIKHTSLTSTARAGRFFTTSATWEVPYIQVFNLKNLNYMQMRTTELIFKYQIHQIYIKYIKYIIKVSFQCD